jgi:O-antigen/teichoic acid export membrane protein
MSIARHTGYNLLGAAVPILVTIVTIPLYLQLIGLDRYGLLAICWTFLGFFGFLGLGMGPAITQRLATMAAATATERSQLVWTGIVVSLAMGLIGSLLVLLAAHFYFYRLSATPGGLRIEVQHAIPWLAAALPLSLASAVMAGALQGRQRFGILNLINSFNTVGTAILPLAVAYLVGPSLESLMIATVGMNFIGLAVLAFAASRFVPLLAPGRPTGQLLRSLGSYGGWMTGTALLSPVVTLVDRFLIGALVGPAAVSAYVIPYNLVSRILMLPASLSSAILPRFAASEREEEQRLQTVAITTLVALLTPLAVVATASLAPFLYLWLGQDLALAATPIGLILVGGFWVHGLAYVCSTIVMARGRPDVLMKLLLAYLIPYLVLLYVLVETMGEIGAAVAWCLKATCDLFLFIYTKPDRPSMVRILEGSVFVIASITIAFVLPWRSAGYWFGFICVLSLPLMRFRSLELLRYVRLPRRQIRIDG